MLTGENPQWEMKSAETLGGSPVSMHIYVDDADKAFQRCLTLMHKFNIYELQDFQPGHLEPFRNYMFPSE